MYGSNLFAYKALIWRNDKKLKITNESKVSEDLLASLIECCIDYYLKQDLKIHLIIEIKSSFLNNLAKKISDIKKKYPSFSYEKILLQLDSCKASDIQINTFCLLEESKIKLSLFINCLDYWLFDNEHLWSFFVIDYTNISSIKNETNEQIIFDTILSLCRKIQVPLIVYGVNNKNDYLKLKRFKVKYMAGYAVENIVSYSYIDLTPRQKEIAILITQGLNNSQIAEKLNISKHTVDSQIGKILRNNNLSNRVAIAQLIQ